MKKKWNIVGLLLAVFVAMMVWPMKEAAGQEKEAYAVFEDGMLTFKYDSNRPESAYGIYGWGNVKKDVVKVVFDKSFGDYRPTSCRMWFYDCSNLVSIDMSNLNTEEVSDMEYMFYGCINLRTIYIGNNWTTSATSGNNSMFYDCINLFGGNGTHCTTSYEAIKYAHVDEGASNPGYFTKAGEQPFAVPDVIPYCIRDDETETLTIGAGKSYPKGAEEFNGTPGYVTEHGDGFSATYADPIYYYLRGGYPSVVIKKIIIDPSFANYKPQTLANWFSCGDFYDLTEIEGLQYINTSDVTDMSNMFECPELTTINFGSFRPKHVTDMSNMFKDCKKLTTIYVDNNWNTSSVKNADNMFYGCEMLYGENGTECIPGKEGLEYAKIDGGKNNPGYFTKTGNSQTKKYEGVQPYAVFDNGTLTLYYDAKRTANSYSMPKWYAGFEVASEVQKVVFDNSFRDYTPVSCAKWFEGSANLTEIVGFEYLNTEYVTDMSQMFYGCSSLTELDLGNFNTANVTNMEGMFNYCSNIQTIFVGESWTTAQVTDYDARLFVECKKLVGGKGTACIDDECQWNANMGCLAVIPIPYATEGDNNAVVSDECLAVIPIPYARIDGGASNPGYFTKVGEPAYEKKYPYAIFNETTGVLTLYFSKNNFYKNLKQKLPKITPLLLIFVNCTRKYDVFFIFVAFFLYICCWCEHHRRWMQRSY